MESSDSSYEVEAHRSEEEGVRYPSGSTFWLPPDDYVPHYIKDERYLIDWSKGRCWTCARRGYLQDTCRNCRGEKKYTEYIGVCSHCLSLGSLESLCTGDYCEGYPGFTACYAPITDPTERDSEEDTDADSGYLGFLSYLELTESMGDSEDYEEEFVMDQNNEDGSDSSEESMGDAKIKEDSVKEEKNKDESDSMGDVENEEDSVEEEKNKDESDSDDKE